MALTAQKRSTGCIRVATGLICLAFGACSFTPEETQRLLDATSATNAALSQPVTSQQELECINRGSGRVTCYPR